MFKYEIVKYEIVKYESVNSRNWHFMLYIHKYTLENRSELSIVVENLFIDTKFHIIWKFKL